jgi:hypothetical protein
MSCRNYLFVCGTPRSGTSYLHAILASHPLVALGLERYSLLLFGHSLSPTDFEEERFLHVQSGDTWYESLDQFPWQRDLMRTHYPNARYVGDKVPKAYEHFEHLISRFQGVRIVCIFRNIFDVAASYEARRRAGTHWRPDWDARQAVIDWNRCLAETLAWSEKARILPVIYEELTSTESSVDRLACFLGIDASPLHDTWRDLARSTPSAPGNGANQLEANEREFIRCHADYSAYERVLELASAPTSF